MIVAVPHAEPSQRRNGSAREALSIEQILLWADAHYARHGRWPQRHSGLIESAAGETWLRVDTALRLGGRGLAPGSSLARLIRAHRPSADSSLVDDRQNAEDPSTSRRKRPPHLEVAQILAWADAHYARTRQWPSRDSGPITESPRDNWRRVDSALRLGLRGLIPGSSLARLLHEQRGVRNRAALPRLTEAQILTWADAYHERHGRWPQARSGPIEDAPGETWTGVETALQSGLRGLAGGSSVAKLLAEHRGLRNIQDLAPLTVEQILAWADAHYARTGRWPKMATGPIAEAPGESWNAVNVALQCGCRGLPGGSTLARLMAAQRGARHHYELPEFRVEQILTWADAHFGRLNQWPRSNSGPIEEAPGETWSAVHQALQKGHRGLPGGSSLSQLLDEHRGVRHPRRGRTLSEAQILAWVDAFYARHGRLPQVRSGPIEEAPGETWSALEAALREGNRGLPGGSSLYRLIRAHRKS